MEEKINITEVVPTQITLPADLTLKGDIEGEFSLGIRENEEFIEAPQAETALSKEQINQIKKILSKNTRIVNTNSTSINKKKIRKRISKKSKKINRKNK